MYDRPENLALMGEDGKLKPWAYHLLAIGRLCLTWAYLDRQLNQVLAEVLNCSEAQAACIANEATDVAERCRMIKTLLYVDAPKKEWRDIFEGILNKIENELAPKRNRYVHDYWQPTEDALARMDRRARLGKPQAFQDKQLAFDVSHATPYGEVDDFTVSTALVVAGIHLATLDLVDWRGEMLKERSRLELWVEAESLQEPTQRGT